MRQAPVIRRALAALGVTVALVATWAPPAGGTSLTGAVPFAPYADVTLWPAIDLARVSAESGIGEFRLF